MTINDESAYDSCMGILYGMRIADSLVYTTLKKAGKKENYPYVSWKIVGYKIVNEEGENIVDKINDSAKAKIEAFWLNQNP